MNFAILASFIVFGVWLTYQLSVSNKNNQKAETDFWKKEHEANSVRKKSLDNLDYIQIPYETFPLDVLTKDQQISECIQQISDLRNVKIVNLAGFTNTDLKLKYGTANITILSEYDQNYTLLARTLYKWGLLLYEAGYEEEALIPLEFALSTKTDISGNYRLLASIYKKRGQISKIEDLILTAESLNTLMKTSILNSLSDIVHNEK